MLIAVNQIASWYYLRVATKDATVTWVGKLFTTHEKKYSDVVWWLLSIKKNTIITLSFKKKKRLCLATVEKRFTERFENRVLQR